MRKYLWLLAAALIFALIFTRCGEGKKGTEPQYQIGQQKLLAMFPVRDSINAVDFVYRVVAGDSLSGLTFKKLNVMYYRITGVDTVRDGFGRPVYDSIRKQYSFKEKYDSVDRTKMIILSPLNIDSLSKATKFNK